MLLVASCFGYGIHVPAPGIRDTGYGIRDLRASTREPAGSFNPVGLDSDFTSLSTSNTQPLFPLSFSYDLNLFCQRI